MPKFKKGIAGIMAVAMLATAIGTPAAAPKAKAGSYDLAPTGDAGATLNLKAQGDAKNVKEDIAKDKTVATITWTFAAGNAAGGISVDDSWEGNHEMGID